MPLREPSAWIAIGIAAGTIGLVIWRASSQAPRPRRAAYEGRRAVYALKADGNLLAFATAEEAIAHCEIDEIDAGLWRFFGATGTPLIPRIVWANPRAGERISGPPVVLEPAEERAPALQLFVGTISTVQGCGVASVEDLKRRLGGVAGARC